MTASTSPEQRAELANLARLVASEAAALVSGGYRSRPRAELTRAPSQATS